MGFPKIRDPSLGGPFNDYGRFGSIPGPLFPYRLGLGPGFGCEVKWLQLVGIRRFRFFAWRQSVRVFGALISGKPPCTRSGPIPQTSCFQGTQLASKYSRPQVNGIWGIWGSYYHIPKAIFHLLKGNYTPETTTARRFSC